ncbi:MAG: ribokinase [Anaerolineaceae bacterium]|nr:ribokinase [Anaerolineaceae bacterium]
MSVVVFGSINIDLVIQSPRFPKAGETIIGNSFYTAPGGKGANQAVAAARMGAPVHMVGRVGKDVYGKVLLDNLKENNVNTEFILQDEEQPTGTAIITVNDLAENTIVTAPGANGQLEGKDIKNLEKLLEKASVLLLQFEVSFDYIIQAAKIAKEMGVTIIQDPAPARAVPKEIFESIDIITPNETEAAMIVGFPVNSEENIQKAAAYFHENGVPEVIIKLGGKGAYWSKEGSGKFIQPHKVKAIDTVAAGDAFNGALAAGLYNGLSTVQAIDWAMAAGALSTTRKGAQPSLPYKNEVMNIMKTTS